MVKASWFQQLSEKFPVVASHFAEHWQSSLAEYAALLYRHQPLALETELLEALTDVWKMHGLNQVEIKKILAQLSQQPVLQTSHHVTPTNGPTFLAIDLISLAGLAQNQTYLVAANSGVAFSNTAWSGALSYGALAVEDLLDKNSPLFRKVLQSTSDRQKDGTRDNRITLIPSKQRDQLVFGTQVSSQLLQQLDQVSPRLRTLLVLPDENEIYSIWAANTCSKLQSRVFNRTGIVFFDVNEVIRGYLLKVLDKYDSHPITQLLFSGGIAEKFNREFETPPLFLGRTQSKKSSKVEGLTWQKQGTLGKKSGFQKYDRATLLAALENRSLCPSIFLQFMILRFLNGIKCLGSFHQAEYLENYRKQWLELNLSWSLHLDQDKDTALTTGRLLNGGQEVWPLDLAWKQEVIQPADFQQQPMSTFWEPIVAQLIG